MGGHGKDASTRGQLLTRRTTGTRICGIAAVLLGVVALCAVGCGGAGLSAPASTAQATTTVTTPEENPGGGVESTPWSEPADSGATSAVEGDRAVWGEALQCTGPGHGVSLSVVLHSPENVPDSEMGMADPELDRLVALSVEIENTGESGVELSLDWFEIEDADGVKYKRAPLSDAPVALLQVGTVAPGERATGYVVFEVPEDVAVEAGAFDTTSGAESGARLTWSR